MNFLNQWCELKQITMLDSAICSHSIRHIFLHCLKQETCILQSEQSKFVMRNLRCDMRQIFIIWAVRKKIQFVSAVLFGYPLYGFATCAMASNLSANCKNLMVVDFQESEINQSDKLLGFINSFKDLRELNLEDCSCLQDAVVMHIDVQVLHRLDVFTTKSCPFKDYGCLHIAKCCKHLLTFVYNPNVFVKETNLLRGLKMSTVACLLENNPLLEVIDIDMKNFNKDVINGLGKNVRSVKFTVIHRNQCDYPLSAFQAVIPVLCEWGIQRIEISVLNTSYKHVFVNNHIDQL